MSYFFFGAVPKQEPVYDHTKKKETEKMKLLYTKYKNSIGLIELSDNETVHIGKHC